MNTWKAYYNFHLYSFYSGESPCGKLFIAEFAFVLNRAWYRLKLLGLYAVAVDVILFFEEVPYLFVFPSLCLHAHCEPTCSAHLRYRLVRPLLFSRLASLIWNKPWEQMQKNLSVNNCSRTKLAP